MSASFHGFAGASSSQGAQRYMFWPQETLNAWLTHLQYASGNSHFCDAVRRLRTVPLVPDAVLNLFELPLFSFPAIFQVSMLLTQSMASLLPHWQAPALKPDKFNPWSNLPGVKVIYPYVMTGLNPTYIQNHGLTKNEVWLIQRFLQRLYAKVELGFHEKLDPKHMDEFFAGDPIYNWSNANVAEVNLGVSTDKLLLPEHFFEQATPLQIMEALNETVRDDAYKRGFKSYNKTRFDESENEVSYYQQRGALAKGWLTREASSDNEGGSDEEEVLPTFAELLNTPAHNCHELLLVAGSILKHLGLEVFQGYIQGVDHLFLLCGSHPKLNSLGDNGVDISWTSGTIGGLFVCDAWANVACNAEQYVANFKAKMQKWGKLSKQIFGAQRNPDSKDFKNEWVNPDLEFDPYFALLDTHFFVLATKL